MDILDVGPDGQPTLHVPYRRWVDRAWWIGMGLLLTNIFFMRDPNVTWPKGGGQIPDVIRLPWLWFCVAVVVWLVVVLLIRWVLPTPGVRIADGRVLVYTMPYRCFRFAADDVTAVTEVVEPDKGSGSRWGLGERWFAIYFGGVAPAGVGSATIRGDIDEVHQQICTLLGVDPSPMPDPPPFDMRKGPSPVRRAFHLPDRPRDDRR